MKHASSVDRVNGLRSHPDRPPEAAPQDRVPAWHADFLKLLPRIQQHARFAFRFLRRETREEAVQEVICNAMVAFVRLIERGKSHVAAALPLARFAVAQVRDGRKVGNSLNVRDVLSPYCQRRKGVVVEPLDRWDDDEECWREILVEDQTCSPADLAASRIDFTDWMSTLSRRDRKMAILLANGESTGAVARRFQLSPSRVSQVRNELQAAWHQFQNVAPRPMRMMSEATRS